MAKYLVAAACGLVSLVAACAAPPPPGVAIPITNVSSIAGKWQGTIYYQGSSSAGTLAVNPDRTWVGTGFGKQSHGTFTLVSGEAQWHSLTTGASGTWALRNVNGVTVLNGRGSNGVTFEEKRPG